jgi:hypothetical protein
MGRKRSRRLVALRKQIYAEDKKLAEALERKTPPLTEQEIDAIAARVADYLAPRARVVSPATTAKLKQLAYDIGVNLVSSGIWHLLVYASAHLYLVAGPEKSDRARSIERRFEDIRRKMREGLDEDEEESLKALDSELARALSWEEILDTEGQAELAELLNDDVNSFWSIAFVNALIGDLREGVYEKLLSST